MKFVDWYVKIAVVSAMIGASMELFMIKTGFCVRNLLFFSLSFVFSTFCFPTSQALDKMWTCFLWFIINSLFGVMFLLYIFNMPCEVLVFCSNSQELELLQLIQLSNLILIKVISFLNYLVLWITILAIKHVESLPDRQIPCDCLYFSMGVDQNEALVIKKV